MPPLDEYVGTYIQHTIERLDIKDGDIILFDSNLIDVDRLMDLCAARFADNPKAPNAWFCPVKVPMGKTIRDMITVVSGANFVVVEKV